MGGRLSRSGLQDSDLGVGNYKPIHNPIYDEEEIDEEEIDADITRAATDWSEVYRCKTSSWVSGISSRFFFDPDVNYFDMENLYRHYWESNMRFVLRAALMQPHNTQGYQFETPIPEIRLGSGQTLLTRMLKSQKLRIRKIKVKKITDCFDYRYLLLSSVPTWYVIGYRDYLAVVQFTDMMTSSIQCFVVDVRSGDILSTFEESLKQPYLYEAYLSPDKSLYLLRPNLLNEFCCSGDQHAPLCYETIWVVSVETKMSHVTHIITVTHHPEYWCSIAFDPRYKWSHIAFGNYTSQHFCDCLVVYDLKTKSVLHQKKDDARVSRNMSFSPGGLYLASLARVLYHKLEVNLYDPDTLDSLHCIVWKDNQHCFETIIPWCTPLFCCTGEYMALTGHHRELVSVYKLPIEQSLMGRCRVVLRKSVREEDVTLLPLPTSLKTFLQFGPCYE